ncbi:Serine protease [Hyella patelloides LEGE 07179]|uniref:Serine protease n=1 Tax=Hyella patelloides LEGE 07179 TaxID=945734 RepID=A0A563W498_9CYAN|nr:serine protease [Hyella patelloides]VEP18467.1 Serine protease [Hyella patelloides LEGE 07179]
MQSEELRDYTVRIKAGSQSGTGFFVASGLILTCAHVVTEGDGRKPITVIKVYWQNVEHNVNIYKLRTNPQVDLALLKFEQPITEHPCVVLDASVNNGDKLYSFGYTDDYPNGDPRDFIYTDLTGDEPPLMTFRGEQVQPGFSGAPLLNKETGKICGLIKRSRDIYTDLGGRGVSTALIFDHFFELKPKIILDNPFNHLGGRIDNYKLVFGREKEVKQIFELLNNNNSVAIIGEAEIGKSSVLRVIEQQAVSQLKSLRKPIYLDLGNICDEEDFYVALCDLVGITLSKGYRLSRELKKHKLLLILDNVEKMTWSGFTNQIRSQIRALAEGVDASLRLVIAVNKPLNRLFSDSSMVSPFENICVEEIISYWNEITTNNFINFCLQNNSIRFTTDEIATIIANSKGHPKQVMRLCHQLYRQKCHE